MSLCKWSYYVWACEVESEADIAWADSELKCGYCKEDKERQSRGYMVCEKCLLYKKNLCGRGPDDAYHRTINKDLSWRVRRKAANEMLDAILADSPARYRKHLTNK